jgi:hypothetical protein
MPIQFQWICRTSVSQAVAPQSREIADFPISIRRKAQTGYWYAEDVSLQTREFRVEWHLAIKTENYVARQP